MSFWDFFFLFLIYIPLVMLWASAIIDIFRRDDMTGVWKAVWVATVILVPFFGTLVYLVVRPAGATAAERQAIDSASRDFVAHYSPDSAAQQLSLLADLEARGKITAEEFAAEKARLLGAGTGTGSAPSA